MPRAGIKQRSDVNEIILGPVKGKDGTELKVGRRF